MSAIHLNADDVEMLTIRDAQLHTLAAGRSIDFEARALAHLQRWMPRHCALLGEAQMREVVRLGWAKAQRHGLVAECTVIGVLDLMCLLGSGFDSDPLLPWAAEILDGPPPRDPVERGDRLYDAAWDYIGRIVRDYRDEGGEPLTERLVVLMRAARGASREAPDATRFADWSAGLSQTLATYFPAKAAVVGDAGLAAVARAARERAHAHGMRSERALQCFGVLLFVLGNGFDDDPLLPWLPPILGAALDEQQRLDRIFATGAAMLRRWWDMEAAARH